MDEGRAFSNNGKAWLHVVADKEYGLERIRERIELDYDLPPTHPSFEKAIQKKVFFAINRYEKAYGWHWRSDIPVHLDLSNSQIEVYDGTFRDDTKAKDQNSLLLVHGRKAYVATITFETPKLHINPNGYVPTVLDGFIKPEQAYTSDLEVDND